MAHSLLTPVRRATDFFENGEHQIDLADGDSCNIVAIGLIRITVIPGAGATVTVSLIDDPSDDAHDTETDEDVTTKTTYDVEYPYYRVSTAGGTARVGVV